MGFASDTAEAALVGGWPVEGQGSFARTGFCCGVHAELSILGQSLTLPGDRMCMCAPVAGTRLLDLAVATDGAVM